MKATTRLAIVLALGTTVLSAQKTAYTAAVGYTTVNGVQSGYTAAVGNFSESLHPGMNLVGLRLHHSTLVSGSLAAVGKDFVELTSLPADDKGESTLNLTEGITYILEITSGAQVGAIQEITRSQGLRLTLPENLAAAGVKPGDQFSIRRAATLNSVFDPRSCSLQSGDDPANADFVGIPRSGAFGDFRQCIILRLPDGQAAWVDAATFDPVGNLPLIYPDALIVFIRGQSDVSLTFSGQVKTGPTRFVVKPGMNLIASPNAAGGYLQKLGLENDLQKLADGVEPDLVLLAKGSYGELATYVLTAEGQWLNYGTGEDVTEPVPVGSALYIDRKGPAAQFSLGD